VPFISIIIIMMMMISAEEPNRSLPQKTKKGEERYR
jgi:hypothetical protein